eukprot:10250185-Ditylum_brightwellii.AAC.2
MRKGTSLSKDLGILPNYPPHCPWPINDGAGFMVVLQTLQASVEPDHYSKESQTFDRIWHIQSTYSNIYLSSIKAHVHRLYFEEDHGRSYRFLEHPTHCPLFD